MNDHDFYMQRCLALAERAAANGESAGCVIIKNGIIISEAAEQSRQSKDITRHAETLAVLDAVKKHGGCEGAVLYSNVEPCILCSFVIRHYKIKEVIFSRPCGELGGTGPRFPILTVEIGCWNTIPIVTRYPESVK